MNPFEEVFRNVVEGVGNRFSSPLYIFFISSWLAWNWNVVYATIFVGEETILQTYNQLKIEYIEELIKQNGVVNTLLLSVLSTLLLVWAVPFFSRSVYKQVKKDKLKLDIIDLQIEQDRLNEAKGLADAQIDITQKETELRETKESIWEKDFQDFIVEAQNVLALDALEKIMYRYGGSFTYETTETHYLKPVYLSILDINGLCTLSSTTSLVISEKGKYFLRKRGHPISAKLVNE